MISIGEIEHTSNDIAGYHTKNLRNGNSMFEILHIRDIQEELKLQVEIWIFEDNSESEQRRRMKRRIFPFHFSVCILCNVVER